MWCACQWSIRGKREVKRKEKGEGSKEEARYGKDWEGGEDGMIAGEGLITK